MDGNIDRDTPRHGTKHSNHARKIVNQLIVAYYEKEVDRTSTVCRLNQEKYFTVKEHMRTIYMQSIDRKPVPNFKKHYPGFEVLTKHFWIRCLQDRSIIRHYTICNSMDPELYRAYVLSLDATDTNLLNSRYRPAKLDENN